MGESTLRRMPSAGRLFAAMLPGMRSLPKDIAELGLFAKRAALLSKGWSDRDLRRAVNQGTIVRVRKGWYSVPSAPRFAADLALDAGIPFVPQPFVAGIGFLDGQIGPSVFVEVDGAKWHDNPDAFVVDRERDMLVAGKNGRVLRFSYPLFRRKWQLCAEAMSNALADDYRLAKQTEFPPFPWRLRPRPSSRPLRPDDVAAH